VNNAGALGTNGPDDWLTVTDYKNIMELNAMGVIRVCQKFKSLVKKEKGRVITVASIAGRVPFPSAGPYCVSKYACEGYMDVLRTELRAFGVSVHILEPGFFRNTGLLDIDMIKSKQLELWNRQSNDVKREYGEQFFKDCKETFSLR
jgi:NAD(P)-dependent dehydrogenase (short-subunit alcohol dehydrogenase family)